MNKTQLVDALAERLGDKKIAAAAVAGLADVVIRTVGAGDKVTITGFGVFEGRARAARTARNPRTGEPVKVQETTVPAFRPGTHFREFVRGTRSPVEADATSSTPPQTASPPTAETGTKKAKAAKASISKTERKSAKASLEFAGTAKKSAKRNAKDTKEVVNSGGKKAVRKAGAKK